MTPREAALEAALREARDFVLSAAERFRPTAAESLLPRIDAALALPDSDLPARLVEGLRPFAKDAAEWNLPEDVDSHIDVKAPNEDGFDTALYKLSDLRRALALVTEAEAAGYTGGKDE